MVGVVCGMVVTQAGGDIVYIEATKMPGKGNLILTGQLGDVMKESAQAALSYIRANADRLGIQPDFMKSSTFISMYLREQYQKKDHQLALQCLLH